MQTLPVIMDNIGQKEYSIVRLNRDNLEDVAKLHAAVYNSVPATGYFLKKYDTAYTGTVYTGFIAYNQENIAVAYYGVIPCFIQYGKEIILAAQSADTMTHPKYRYKGMFVELSGLTFELCRELGIRLIFGFPNQNSYHGAVNKLGWKMTHRLDYFSIPVKGLRLESICSKFPFLGKLYGLYRHSVLKKYINPSKGVKSSADEEGFATVYRSKDYFQYKTYSQSQVIRIDNTLIWIKGKHGLMIGDIEGLNEKNFVAVLETLIGVAKKLGVKEIQFHCSPGIRLHSLFSAYCEPSPSYPALFQDFGSPVPPEKIKFTFADIDIF
ncbi:MAG TPA: GNAT family N-acetyltransferase [Chitinophagaceae bacterium]|nr:GNAT family N-acetyltransferase [Chitinophagaceae bacterium]